MTVMKHRASIFISAWALMKSEMGSMKTIMRIMASITAKIMMRSWLARPTAVMTESMENTTSMTMMVATAPGRLSGFLGLSECFSSWSAFSSSRFRTPRSSVTPL